jgi:hypothetical protein
MNERNTDTGVGRGFDTQQLGVIDTNKIICYN